MTDPWKIYDELIDGIDATVEVRSAVAGLRWCQVLSSEDSLGMAFTMDARSRPTQFNEPTFAGAKLRDIALLAKSWNLAEAGIGQAAINAWYAQPERAAANGFTPSAQNPFSYLFDPYAQAVAGKTVSIIGHFPFAPAALEQAGELRMLERNTLAGDYPDSACEYLLPDSDFVFISGSAFVNKTIPRLLELSRDATTVVVGPSTPISPVLFEHGVDAVTSFVSTSTAGVSASASSLTFAGMSENGYRVERSAV